MALSGSCSIHNLIIAADSNYGEMSNSMTDQVADDYRGMQGTSMSAPHVAGLAQLAIDAIIQTEGSWTWSQANALRVKQLICMGTWEVNAGETYNSDGSNPADGVPQNPPLNRIGRDYVEGFGMVRADAVIQAITHPTSSSLINEEFYLDRRSGSYAKDPKVLLFSFNASVGFSYNFSLNVPATGDFDLIIYDDDYDPGTGKPIVSMSSINSGLGTNESLIFTPSENGTYYWSIRAVEGYGLCKISYSYLLIDHDLSVSLEVPTITEIYSTYTINATVSNAGINNESNVDMFLYLDGVQIDSITVLNLTVGASQTINYVWTPYIFKTYNFTAYAPPVLNETIIINNVVTELITISTLRNYTMTPGAPYVWIDASGGTELLLSDDGYASIPLPFDFTFYNETYSTIYLGANGYLSFTDSSPSEFSNALIPSAITSDSYLIAPFWDALYPPSGGNIYVQSFGTYWVAEWANVNHFFGSLVGAIEATI